MLSLTTTVPVKSSLLVCIYEGRPSLGSCGQLLRFKDRLVEKYGWDEETQNEKWQEALADPKTLRMKDQMGEVVISYLEDVVATAGRSLMHDKAFVAELLLGSCSKFHCFVHLAWQGIRRTTEVDEESVDPANLHESALDGLLGYLFSVRLATNPADLDVMRAPTGLMSDATLAAGHWHLFQSRQSQPLPDFPSCILRHTLCCGGFSECLWHV